MTERLEGYRCHENNYHSPPAVSDDPRGCWCCSVDKIDNKEFFWNFLEMHPGAAWENSMPANRKVVFRVSKYNGYNGGTIQLGDCAILNREQLDQLIERALYLRSKMTADAEEIADAAVEQMDARSAEARAAAEEILAEDADNWLFTDSDDFVTIFSKAK